MEFKVLENFWKKCFVFFGPTTDLLGFSKDKIVF
jgi:hypothetical protein